MFRTQRWSAFLGVAVLVGCASTGDLARTEVFDAGDRIEYSAAGKPVRYTNTSGQVFAVNSSLLVEQVFNDGSRIEYNAAEKPVFFTDSSGQRFAVNSSMLVEERFDDGSRIEYSAAQKPVRTTDVSGKVYAKAPTHTRSSIEVARRKN